MNEKDKPTVLLEFYLKKLRLPTMLREYASLAVVCREDRSDFPTYLLRLIERELLDREKRSSERRIKEAAFPVVKTIDTFDFKSLRVIFPEACFVFRAATNLEIPRSLLRGGSLNI